MSRASTHQAAPYRALTSDVVTLSVRQNPKQACVTAENKEKTRKPVDPPPIVQLLVDQSHDNGSHYLVNPFLFMTATLVNLDPEDDGTYAPVQPNHMIGTYASSLHRLKDVDNRDGGFFVFGDISCRNEGSYRLQFSLFEIRDDSSQFVSSAVSLDFKVKPAKDVHGVNSSLPNIFRSGGTLATSSKRPRETASPERPSPNYASSYGAASQPRDSIYPVPRRQRLNSDATSQLYSSAQLVGGPVSHYGTSSWPNYGSQNYYAGQNIQTTGPLMPVQTQNLSVPQSGLQRTYSTNSYSGYNSPTTITPSSRPAVDSFCHQPGYQPMSINTAARSNNDVFHDARGYQYSTRTPSDPYSTAHGLQTPTSGSDGGMGQPQQHNLMLTGTELSSQGSRGSIGQMTAPSMSMGPGLHNTTYGMPSASLNTATQPYSSMTGSGNLDFSQPASQASIKSEARHYAGITEPFMDSSHDPYGSTGFSLPDSNTALNTGLLNRSFAPSHPPQQNAVVGGVPEDELGEYKTQSHAYPTPNQTSPMG